MESDIDDDITDLEEVVQSMAEQSQGADPQTKRAIFIIQIVVLLFGFIKCCIKARAGSPRTDKFNIE